MLRVQEKIQSEILCEVFLFSMIYNNNIILEDSCYYVIHSCGCGALVGNMEMYCMVRLYIMLYIAVYCLGAVSSSSHIYMAESGIASIVILISRDGNNIRQDKTIVMTYK